MLNETQKSILIKSIKVRVERGENVVDIFKSYKNLTDDEKTEILALCELEYDPTLEEIKVRKINDFSSICKNNIENGVTIKIDGEDEHFTYGIESGDQGNIDDIFNLAVTTGLSQPYHSSNGNCKLYTVEQITELYIAVKYLKAKETTYFNQMKQYIKDTDDKETIKAMTYGQELTGKYLENYNSMMTQSQAIIESLVGKDGKLK